MFQEFTWENHHSACEFCFQGRCVSYSGGGGEEGDGCTVQKSREAGQAWDPEWQERRGAIERGRGQEKEDFSGTD